MTTPLLGGTIATLMTDVSRKGGTPIDRIFEWVAGSFKWKETCAGATDRGFATITIPADSRVVGSLAELLVLRIDQPQPAGSATPFRTYEFRITQLDDKAFDPNVVVTLSPIINDFGRVQLRTVNAGVPSKITNFTGTPSDFINALLLPALAAQGETGIVAGTILDGPATTYTQRNASVLGVLSFLEQTYTTDAFLERIDDATTALNLTTRGSAALSPRAILGKNVAELERIIVVDDSIFANRVEPEGSTASSESEPTTIAQAAWDAAARGGTGGRDITLADPLAGDGPVTFDGEVDGKRAFYALDPLHLEAAETILLGSTIGNKVLPGVPLTIALDPTRGILWGYTQNDTDTIWWRDIVDDSNTGTLSLGAGALWIERLVYDAVNDRIVAACGDVAKVVIVNAGTKAVAGTVTTTGGVPAHLCGVGNGHVIIGYLASAAFDVISCSGSGSVQGQLAGTSGFDGRASTVVYHTSTNRYFVFSGATGFPYYNASTLASVSTGAGLAAGAVVNTDPGQTAIAAMTLTHYYSVDPSTGVVTTTATPTFPYSPSTLLGTSNLALIGRFGRLYVVGAAAVIAYDVTTNAWLTPIADVGRNDATPAYLVGMDLQVGASADDSATLYVADVGSIRRSVLRKFVLPADAGDGYWISPFDSWDVQASSAGAQTITAPASGSGGPVSVAVDADGTGQGAMIEIRENANLDYRTQLADPTSVGAFGAIDSSPQFDILAKRNYWRGSASDSTVWRSSRTNRWLSAVWEGPDHFGVMEQRWSQADQTGFAFQPLTTTATWTNSPTTPDLTLAISGANAGQVFSPGDLITTVASYHSASSDFFYVRQRTVADSGGNATIPVTPLLFGAANLTSGSTVYLSSPSLLIPNNKSDCIALYPTRAVTSTATIKRWPTYTATMPIPKMVGDQRAWVFAHVKIACYAVIPADLKLAVFAPFTPSALSPGWPQVITPADTVQLTTGELRDYWLSVPIDTINYPAHGFIKAQLTMGPSSAMINGLTAVVYVQSLGVILAANTPQPQDVYGAEAPVALYQLAADRLKEISQPTKNYQLKVIEEDPARPWIVGAIATLRDPKRGIFAQDQSSRVISVTEYGLIPDSPLRLPDIEIGHSPLNSFVAGIVTTGAAVTTPPPALLPGSPLPGGVGGGGGIGGGEPGTLNAAIPLLNIGTDAGAWQAQARYDIDNSMDYVRAGSTRNGGDCWRTVINSSAAATMATQKTDVSRTVFIDLQGKTIPADGMLIQQWMDNVSFTPSLFFWLDNSYILHAGRTDSAGDVALPGCDAASAIPATGGGWLELIGKIDGSAGAAIAYWTPLGGARVRLFDEPALNTVSDDNTTGTGVGVDVLGPSAWTATTGNSNGPAGVLMDDEHAFDRTGVSLDDVSGRCCVATTFPGAAGHYADVVGTFDDFAGEDQEGDYVAPEFTANDQRLSFKLTALDANVGQVNAAAPFYSMRRSDSTDTGPIGRTAIRSASTDAESADVPVPSFTVLGGQYWGFNVDAATDDLNPRFAQLTDPSTSTAWTLTDWANAEVVWRQRIASSGALLSQLGVDVSCYPATSTNGPGVAVGSRPIPYRIITGASLDAADTAGNEVYQRLNAVLAIPATVVATGALPGNTYANGSSGVGATLTATATGTLTVDGHLVALNDYVLANGESTQTHNGLYKCTTAGAVGVAYVLTRAVEMDEGGEFPARYVHINAGSTKAGTDWEELNALPIVVGSDAVNFTQRTGGNPGTGDLLGSGSGTDSSRFGNLRTTKGDVDLQITLRSAQNANSASHGVGKDDFSYSVANAPGFLSGNSVEVYQAVWMDLNSSSIATELGLLRVFAGLGTAEQVRLSLNSSRQFVATRRDTSPVTLQTSTATAPSSGRFGIAWRVRINPQDSTGADSYIKVWLTTSGPTTRTLIIDTEGTSKPLRANGFGNTCGAVGFFGVYGSATDGAAATFDDPVVANPGTTSSSTAMANGRWGNLAPNGAGTYGDSTAHDYTKVIDADNSNFVTPDSDYNVFTAANKKDTYALASVAGDASTILAAMVYAYICLPQSPSGTGEKFRPLLIISGTLLRGPVYINQVRWPGGSSMITSRFIMNKNRVTGVAITPSDLNGAEAGGEVLTHTNDDTWLRQVGVDYFYEWTI